MLASSFGTHRTGCVLVAREGGTVKARVDHICVDSVPERSSWSGLRVCSGKLSGSDIVLLDPCLPLRMGSRMGWRGERCTSESCDRCCHLEKATGMWGFGSHQHDFLWHRSSLRHDYHMKYLFTDSRNAMFIYINLMIKILHCSLIK